jgi:hypothetical protein
MQEQPTTDLIEFPSDEARDLLTPILREGAQKMLMTAIELEARTWIGVLGRCYGDRAHQGPVRDR